MRVLQEQTFTRVGGAQRVEVDVRVIASSNPRPAGRDPGRRSARIYSTASTSCRSGCRRWPSAGPTIPPLARHFIARSAEIQGLPARPLGEDALAALQTYDWPGNVRQLRNAMDWILIMATGEPGTPIRADALPPEIGAIAPAVLKLDRSSEMMALPLREARELFEREYLMSQITRFGGNISKTAEFVGMERSALHRKLKSLGVHGGGDRAGGEREAGEAASRVAGE